MQKIIALLLVAVCVGCGSSSSSQASKPLAPSPSPPPGPPPPPPGPSGPPAPPGAPAIPGVVSSPMPMPMPMPMSIPGAPPSATPAAPATPGVFTQPAHGQLVGSTSGEYAVWFPAAPYLEQPPKELAALGGKAQIAVLEGKDLERTTFVEFAFEQTPNPALMAAVPAQLFGQNSPLGQVHAQPTTFLDRIAMELTGEQNGIATRAVFFVEGKSIFGVVWGGPPGRMHTDDVKNFFASFHRRAADAPALPALAVKPRSAEGAAESSTHQTVSLGGGEFTVRLPILGKSKEEPPASEYSLSGENGTMVKGSLRSWSSITPTKSIVSVTELTMPEDMSPRMFAEVCRLLGKPQKITSQSNRMAAGLHALQVDGERQRYISCYCGKYAYILNCFGSTEAGDVQEFFNSFRVAGTSPPEGATATAPIPFIRAEGDPPPEVSSIPMPPPSIPGAPPGTSPPPVSPVDEARRFDLLDGFQIVMPEGEVKKYEAPTRKTAGVTEDRIELKLDKGTTFKVTVDQSKFSAKVPETFVKAARERAKKDKTFQENQTTVAGFPTLQQEFGDKVKTRIQMIHTGESFVRLTWIGDPSSAEAKAFFDSFRRKEGYVAPATPMPEPGRSKIIPSGL